MKQLGESIMCDRILKTSSVKNQRRQGNGENNKKQ